LIAKKSGKKMEITLQLFGAFRPLGQGMCFCLKADAKLSDLRIAFAQKLAESDAIANAETLLASSRFASDTQILNEDMQLQNGAKIAIIPPVAGG
jgi:molybdopterin converting factor small subunit